MPSPAVVALEMGYGHLRPAYALARHLSVPLLRADSPPLCGESERRLWDRTRGFYETLTRLSQRPLVGAPLRLVLDGFTHIPHLHPYRDLSAPTAAARATDSLIRRGLGDGVVSHLKQTGQPLLTTFYTPALAADRAGLENVWCVVTDADINRVWAPMDGAKSRVRYLAPTDRARRRLRAYGVRAENVLVTGFPLPHSLLGGPTLPAARANLARRLVRLDPAGEMRRAYAAEIHASVGELPELTGDDAIPSIVYAVGGAGAHADYASQFLVPMARALAERRWRLTLVAGIRPEVAERFEALARRLPPEARANVDVLHEPRIETYFERFEERLARADVLWTKPSEMTFYGALGLPLVLSAPVGWHERYNRRWAREAGAGLKARDPRFAHEWLRDWLDDGTLAGAAWNGFHRLPNLGLYRICEAVCGKPDGYTLNGSPSRR